MTNSKYLSKKENISEILNQTSLFLQTSQYVKAEKEIYILIEKYPNNLNYQNLLAIIYAGQKKFKESINVLNKIIKKNSNFIEAYINLGNVYNDLGQLNDSVNFFKQALAINSNHTLTLYNLANVYDKQKHYTKASTIYSQLIKNEPNNLEYLNSYSSNQIKLANLNKAKVMLNKILKVNSKYIEAVINLGVVYKEEKNYDKAIKYFNSALEIKPNHPTAYFNLGTVFEEKQEYHDAINYFNKAIKNNPNYVEAYYNLGCVFDYLGRYNDAITNYKKAISYDSQHTGARYNLARDQLRTDDFINGWKGYELRRSGIDSKYKKLNIPLEKIWDGSKFEGTLIVHGEQGIGDEVLYSSMFTDLLNYHKDLTISVDKRLIPIMQRSFPEIKFLDRKKSFFVEQFSKHIFAGSLGKFFRKSANDFKANISPWLIPNKKNINQIEKIIPSSKKIKVGISWKSPTRVFADKNISLLNILSVLTEEHFEVINLQYGDAYKDIRMYESLNKRNIIHFNDFDYTNDLESIFALIYHCDFIISISNSTIHFSGALGKPVFSLIPTRSHWYWHAKRKECLWYPSVKLFKQTKWRQWNDPLGKIAKEIKLKYK